MEIPSKEVIELNKGDLLLGDLIMAKDKSSFYSLAKVFPATQFKA
jgi:hypothetical protein